MQRCRILTSSDYTKVIEEGAEIQSIPRWFPGCKLNYAENLLNNGQNDKTAIIQACMKHALALIILPLFSISDSSTEYRHYSYGRLRRDVAGLSASLRTFGLKAGDHVCAYLPNCYETTIAMLATAALGCVWASAALDFGGKLSLTDSNKLG